MPEQVVRATRKYSVSLEGSITDRQDWKGAQFISSLVESIVIPSTRGLVHLTQNPASFSLIFPLCCTYCMEKMPYGKENMFFVP
jgi:hypothetical protein